MQVNILEAKTNLSNLVRLIETGKEDRIIIARYGKPVVKMVVYNEIPEQVPVTRANTRDHREQKRDAAANNGHRVSFP